MCPRFLLSQRYGTGRTLLANCNCNQDSFILTDTLVVIEPEQPKLEVKPVFKCNVEGESYYEGQRFYPKNESCLKCICGVGFNGWYKKALS